MKTRLPLVVASGLLLLSSMAHAGKPLKFFILAGQSNMTGRASFPTFEAIGMDPKTAPMLKDMKTADGKPVVCENAKLLEVGISQQGYHYWGSAKFYAQAGKAFAEAIPGIQKTNP